MIVSTITFDEWDFWLRVHRPNGFAFLYEKGIPLGLFFQDSVTNQLRFKLGEGRQILSSRIIILLDIVSSML